MARNVVQDRETAEYVTNWPAVYFASGIGMLSLAGVVAAMVVTALQPEPPRNFSFTLPLESGRDTMRLAAVRASDNADDLAPLPKDSGVHFPVPSPSRAVQQSIVRGTSVAARALPSRWLPLFSSAQSFASPEPLLAMLEVEVSPEHQAGERIKSDRDLYEYLLNDVAEINLESTAGTAKSLFESTDVKQQPAPITTADVRDDEELLEQFTAKRSLESQRHLHLEMLQRLAVERSDLRGLPLRDLSECFTPAPRAKHNQEFTSAFREFTSGRRDPRRLLDRSASQNPYSRSPSTFADLIKASMGENQQEQVTVLEQILQPESREYRVALVEVLAQIPGQDSSAVLARRALYDLDEDVRSQAVGVLSKRPTNDAHAVLEAGLRHPLATVQANAFWALNQFRTRHEQQNIDVPARHISVPYRNAVNSFVVDELVKVNHLRNCVLCHPKSAASDQVLRGQIPTPGRPLPRIYYNSNHGDFVRADIVYLRQDFSVSMPVQQAKPWPDLQRFDFFVRTRPATDADFERDREQLRQMNATARNRLAATLRGAIAELRSSFTLLHASFIVKQT